MSSAEDYLHEMNKSKTIEFFPVILFLVLLMSSGISGNTLVLLYYSKKTTRRSNSVAIYILVLAAVDLFQSVIAMPLQIYDLCSTFTYSSSALCKFRCVSDTFGISLCGFIDLAVVVERYLTVCKNKKKTVAGGKFKKLVVLMGAAIGLSIPSFMLFDTVPYTFSKHNQNITGYQCAAFVNPGNKLGRLFIRGIQSITLVIIITIMALLYTRIARTVSNHHKRMIEAYERQVGPQSEPGSSAGDRCHQATQEDQEPKVAVNKVNMNTNEDSESSSAEDSSVCKEVVDSTVSGNASSSCNTEERQRVGKALSMKKHLKAKRITAIMLMVISVLCLGLVPTLCVSVYRTVSDSKEDEMTVWYQFIFSLFFLNSAVNHFIYAFYDIHFRRFVKTSISCKLSIFRSNSNRL